MKLGLIAVAALSLVGCATASTDEDELEQHAEALSAGFIADVTAAGNGCPAGSWESAISPDGQTFTVTFNRYEVKVAPGQLVDIKQCLLNVNFRDQSGGPISVIVTGIHHQGYVLLDSPGMRAARTTSYAFGAALPTQRAELRGPIDQSYLQTDRIFTGWSRCSRVSNLVVNSNLMMQNNATKTGTGYLNSASVDGELTIAFKLDWRRC